MRPNLFTNQELGEEYDVYQETNMNVFEVIEYYEKMKNYNPNDEKNIKKRERDDIIDKFQDIVLDDCRFTNNFQLADEFMIKNNIDIKELDVLVENALGLEDICVSEYLIRKKNETE